MQSAFVAFVVLVSLKVVIARWLEQSNVQGCATAKTPLNCTTPLPSLLDILLMRHMWLRHESCKL